LCRIPQQNEAPKLGPRAPGTNEKTAMELFQQMLLEVSRKLDSLTTDVSAVSVGVGKLETSTASINVHLGTLNGSVYKQADRISILEATAAALLEKTKAQELLLAAERVADQQLHAARILARDEKDAAVALATEKAKTSYMTVIGPLIKVLVTVVVALMLINSKELIGFIMHAL
jgi:hypothetical protein